MDAKLSTVALGLGLLYFSAAGATPTAIETAQLVASDGEVFDGFGAPIAVDGDTALIGATGDDDLGDGSGAVYVFTRDASGVWTQQQKLTASDAVADYSFGVDIALDGDTAVIGKYSYDFFYPTDGAAYVFTRDSSGVWTEKQKLTAYDGFAGDLFGQSVAISGNTIIIGADGDNDQGTFSGSAYVFTSDSAGIWNVQQKLTASDGEYADWFGSTIDIDGDTAVITATGYDYNGSISDSGAAYVFTRDSAGVWSEQQKLLPGDPATYSGYCNSVSISGDNIAISAFTDDTIDVNTGAVYLFKRDTYGVWSQQQKLYASDVANSDYFGSRVDLVGSNLAIGADGVDDNGVSAGAAYLFVSDANGVWNEQIKMLASDASDGDYLKHVAIADEQVLVGTTMHDTSAGINAGTVYIYDVVPRSEPDISPSTNNVNFGDVMVGETGHDVVIISNIGLTDLAITDISITSGVDFTQTNDCPAVLLPASTCQVSVQFTPTVAGVLTDTLSVLSNDPDEPSISVTLTGNGINTLPDLVVTNISSPDPLIIGEYVTVGLTIANQGDADVVGGYYVYLYLDNTFLGFDWISYAPAVGATKAVDWFIQVPTITGSQYGNRNHTLKAIVDTDNNIREWDETNNTLTIPVEVSM